MFTNHLNWGRILHYEFLDLRRHNGSDYNFIIRKATIFNVMIQREINTFDVILCLTLRTTVTSVRILDEDVYYRARNLCVFSRFQKGTARLTHKGCVLQRVSLGALSDITIVLGMRQTICSGCYKESVYACCSPYIWCTCMYGERCIS